MILRDGLGTEYSFHFWVAHDPISRYTKDDYMAVTAHKHRCPVISKRAGIERRSPCRAESVQVKTTLCSRSDHFTPEKGCSLLLAEAMKLLGIPRHLRTELWREYFRKTGQLYSLGRVRGIKMDGEHNLRDIL